MCMHYLKYVKLNRKKQLKNMGCTTPEVTMLADISSAHSVNLSVYQCVAGPPLKRVYVTPFGCTQLCIGNCLYPEITIH